MKNSYLVMITITLLWCLAAKLSAYQNDYNHFDKMAKVLNKSVDKKYLQIYFKDGFYIKKDKVPVNFFIYDLVDTSNNTYPPKFNLKKSVNLKQEGVYHFAPWDLRISFSHIAVIKESKIKIFRHINCDQKGDNIEDVIKYVKEKSNYNQIILEQIRNYRHHGVYVAIDDMSEVECDLAKY